MYAGLLKEPIEIYEQTSYKSSYGVVTDSLSLSYSTRAKVSHISGSRNVTNDEIYTPYSKNFVVRDYVPVNDTSWIKYGGSYWLVTGIDLDKDLRQKIITTELVKE